MNFEWDEAKSRRNLAERGFDFAYAAHVFKDLRRLERVDLRRDYGEERRQTIGDIGGRIFLIVFTKRGEFIRIISARRAHGNEERAYRESTPWN